MERVAHAPREQWAARLEAQGFPFHSVDAEGTAQHDGRFHYWREDFAYRFEAAEIERMYEAAGELHAMALALVEDLAFRDVTSRLAKILLEDQDGGTPRLTQELLAAMAGSRREVVGRALKALSQEGAVKLERGRIHVLDRNTLEHLAWM